MINRFSTFLNEAKLNKNAYNFILGETVLSNGISNNQLMEIIEKKKHKLLKEIKGFDRDKKNKYNTGVHSENIVRLLFDAVNLNHFQKNHPNVDIGVIQPIPGITKDKEVISVKSSISKITPAGVLTDAKAIKLETLFSYLLFSYYDYSEKLKRFDDPDKIDAEVIEKTQSKRGYTPQMMLRDASDIVYNTAKEDFDYYKPMMNIITYYLTTNKENGDFHEDIKNLALLTDKSQIPNLQLSTGVKYFQAEKIVREKINKLDTPISIAVVYLPDYKENGITVTIKKSNDLPLNIFWQKLLDKWCTEKYFNIFGTGGNRVVKYLRDNEFREMFGEWQSEINISTGAYKYTHKSEKIRRMYISNQLRDDRFGSTPEEENAVLDVISKTIDTLSKKPPLVTKFKEFLDSV